MEPNKETATNNWKTAGVPLSMVIFGTIGVFRRNITVSSPALAFLRGVIGTVFLFSYAAVRRKFSGDRLTKPVLALLIFSGALIGLNWVLLFEAYRYTSVAVATLCYYMQPTIVIMLSPLLFREKLTPTKLVCAAAAVIGMVLVSGVTGAAGAETGNAKGVLLGLGAAALYATVVIINKKMPQVDAYKKTVAQLASAALVLLPYLAVTGNLGVSGAGARDIVLILIMGIVHTGLAYLLYFGGMDGLKAQTIAIFSYIDPVTALILSAVILGEPLGLSGVVGAVLILGATAVSELMPVRERPGK